MFPVQVCNFIIFDGKYTFDFKQDFTLVTNVYKRERKSAIKVQEKNDISEIAN